MNTLTKTYVGVDISKKMLDVYVYPHEKLLRIQNSNQGLQELQKKLKSHHIEQVVCEASGNYELNLVSTLRKACYKVWVVNPAQVKAFIRSEGVKVKTDAHDARMLALFGVQKQSRYKQEEPSEKQAALHDFTDRREELLKIVDIEKKRMQNPRRNTFVQGNKRIIRALEKELEKIESEIRRIVSTDIELKKKSDLLNTIPGVGEHTANAVIAYLPELGQISNKAIAALVGSCPYPQESGTYRGKSRINGGRAKPRRKLYMAALVAARYNPVLARMYKGMVARGKTPKQALVANIRKLIITMNTMIQKCEAWNEHYTSFGCYAA